MKMKAYIFKYENLGGRMRLSAIDPTNNVVIASATYVSSGPNNPAELEAAHKSVHEAANIWAGGSPYYRYTVPRMISFKKKG